MKYFYVKQMDSKIIQGTLTSCPGAGFQNIHLWKVLHRRFASKPTERTLSDLRNVFLLYLYLQFLILDMYLGILGVFWVVLQCCGTFSCRWPWGHVSVQLTNIYSLLPQTFPSLAPAWPSHLFLLFKATLAMQSLPEIALTKFWHTAHL